MPNKFVPQYDVKIRSSKLIIEWRFGAHPTVHAVSPSGIPLIVRRPKKSTSSLSNLSIGGTSASTLSLGGGTPTPAPTPTALSGPRGGNYSVLPPIRETGIQRNGSYNLSELDDIMLKNEVLRAVKETPERVLQSVLSNMRAQDRDRDGILSSDSVKGTLKKFQLRLSEDALKNLCRKFGQNGERMPMVRYEDMFSYLTKSRMEVLRAPPQAPTSQVGGMNYVAMQHPTHRKISLRNKVLFSDRDEAKLTIDLERELADKPVNMADLRRIMIDLDRDRNDFISEAQVETAFAKCGIILSPDVKGRLLLATDRTGAGIYKIDKLMNYLTRVKPEAHNVLLGNSYQPREARVGRLPMYQNQSMLTAPWEYNNLSHQQRFDTFPDEGFSEEQYEVMPYHQMEAHPSHALPPPPSPLEEVPEEFDMQKWALDYNSLAQAVYSSDPNQNGYMKTEDVRRVTSTYSLVYNLRISDASINSALAVALDPNYGEVNLEYFIAVLQDLHFREIQEY